MKNYTKLLKKISNDGEKIDTKKVAVEIITWLINNAESYIDNHAKMFKIDLIIDNAESLKTAKALQDLYQGMPSAEEEAEIDQLPNKDELLTLITQTRDGLDRVTKQVWDDMRASKEEMDQLFKKLIFYYELKGFTHGKPLVQELKGYVDVINFEYESFSMGVKVIRTDPNATEENKVISDYNIPEGFTCWIELTYSNVQRPAAMF